MSFYNATTGKLDEWKGVVLEPLADGKCHVALDDGKKKSAGRRQKATPESFAERCGVGN